MEEKSHAIINLLSDKKNEILDAWMKEQLSSETLREDLISLEDLQKQSDEFLEELIEATRSGWRGRFFLMSTGWISSPRSSRSCWPWTL